MPATPGNSLNITAAGIVCFDGVATFTATTTTLDAVLVGGAGNTISSLALGTSGWALTSQGAGNPPIFAAIPYTPIPWTDKAVNFPVVAGNGYFFTAIATATLPAGTQGATIAFAVDNAAALTIQAAAGQTIRCGRAISAAAGTCVSNFQGDSITLVYRLSDTCWIATDCIGTWTIT